MKKAAFLISAILAAGCGVPENAFLVEGYVPTLKDSTRLILTRFEGEMLIPVDTAHATNGRFSFRYPATGKGRLAILTFSDDVSDMFLPLWSAPGEKAVITGDNNYKRTWSVKSRIPEQREAERYKQAAKKEYEKLQQISMEYRKLSNTHGVSADSIADKRQALKHTEDSLQYLIYDKTLEQLGRSGSASPVFGDDPSGICLTIRHYEAFAGLRERAEIQYDRLPEEIKRSQAGKEMYVALHPPAKVRTGDRMADTELVDSNGETHRLSEYLGKYVLLDFWSFGCGPCLLSLPELKAASESYRDRLTVISITSDPKDLWQTASEEHGITWVNLNASDDPAVSARYGVNGIPHQVIISPAGIVLDSWAGYGQGLLEQRLKTYLSD